VTVSEYAGRWFLSVLGPEIPEGLPNGKPVVGCDLGITRLATLSDGTVIENPRSLALGQKKIKRMQREVSRKKKGSKNRRKARAKLANAHRRVCNVRENALHQATTMLAKNHGRIVIEDLNVKNMVRKGGSRKRGLNRALLDVSFGEFRRLLEYKGKRFGSEIIVVNPAYTSQRCSSCGHVEKANRASQAEFLCLSCGFEANADLNAAINILVAGSCPETLNACGEDVRPKQLRLTGQTSEKQESAGLEMSRNAHV
jgi:putative transposase